MSDQSLFDTRYEIQSSIEWIRALGYKRVALQFPDDMLPHSFAVAEALEAVADCRCYILADTSYGSCCVDEVAAQHVNADAIIHYGEACLSPYVTAISLFFSNLFFMFMIQSLFLNSNIYTEQGDYPSNMSSAMLLWTLMRLFELFWVRFHPDIFSRQKMFYSLHHDFASMKLLVCRTLCEGAIQFNRSVIWATFYHRLYD